MTVYDLETFNIDRVIPYANTINRLSKTSGKDNRDISKRKLEKCIKDCIVFKGTVSINEKLDHVLQFKGETKTVNKNFLYFIYKY